ncbi:MULTISPECIES: discoidin domain-containing protein [unclassified Nodularia (in: cyanobacteria)]|uniref:discoidin domain-containing protein n=1 Tax=unclassified Nodularia (in: cyanobacteria) TaxID=2656917 RepID=UPI001881FBEB|nr:MULTISPECIES: discoidin domain-containing protein [unclassified Nodularia (in: cyanobacteria)]MBE9200615.1 discoidin domain-containing protein [Nodularia sp. LEGE 06071]MCC2695409.1 discoidin domain-containing protein [Nodularia sp. LEGE 04288]
MIDNLSSISKILQSINTSFLILFMLVTGCATEKQQAETSLPTSESSLITKPVPSPVPTQTDIFQDAAAKAMSAATISQSAQSQDDWNLVMGIWKEAITLMQSVPKTSSNYALAQKKASEYQQNLAYVTKQSLKSSTPIPVSQTVTASKPIVQQVAVGKKVIARQGGITYPGWANANDPVDYNTTTNYPQMGRWGNETNNGNGTFQIIDLGSTYQLNRVGYNIDWDGGYKNPLTFIVEVSTDNQSWHLVSKIIHPYSESGGSNKIDINVPIKPIAARYVKYWEPSDGNWNGWGTFHQLRAYSIKQN